MDYKKNILLTQEYLNLWPALASGHSPNSYDKQEYFWDFLSYKDVPTFQSRSLWSARLGL